MTALESKYQSEYRGVVQYYLLAHNVGWFNQLHWIAETSLLKTLAGKHRSSVTKMAKRYKATIETPHGPRKCLQVVVQRDNKKPLVTHFGGIPLKRKQDALLVDRLPQFVMTNRSELLQRMLTDICELCGSKEKVEVHHIRKLADLEKPGRREKPVWVKLMAAKRRKTLVVCRQCHEAIHSGTSTILYPCLRVATDEIKGEMVRSLPPRRGIPLSMKTQNLEIESNLCSNITGKRKSLTKFASQLTIDSLEQGSTSHPLEGEPFQLIIRNCGIKIPFKGRNRLRSHFTPSHRPNS